MRKPWSFILMIDTVCLQITAAQQKTSPPDKFINSPFGFSEQIRQKASATWLSLTSRQTVEFPEAYCA